MEEKIHPPLIQGDFSLLTPVADIGKPRPMVSVMIPVYNTAHYLAETLQSVLEQDAGPEVMEIWVVDDASTDNPEAVVQQLGKGRVNYHRQPQNKGYIHNFETALNLSRGYYVHLLHADDRVLPGFYRHMLALLQAYPQAGAAFCRHYFINEAGDQFYISPLAQSQSGIMADFFERILQYNLIQTPAILVKRQVYETIGMFDRRFLSLEDYEMWARIGRHYPIAYLKIPLAEYRNMAHSLTNRVLLQHDKWAIRKALLAQFCAYKPESAAQIKAAFHRQLVLHALHDIKHLKKMGQHKKALQLLKKVLPLPQSTQSRLRLIKAAIK